MEIGLREWLLLLGTLLIVLILLDGWRRMRRRERDRLRFNLDRRFGFPDEKKPLAQKNSAPEKIQPVVLKEEEEDEPLLPSLHAEIHTEVSAQPDDPLHPVESGQEPEAEEEVEVEQKEADTQTGVNKKSIEDVLVIHVLARDDKGFFGPALLQCILESGLRFGERNIFHRHANKTGSGEVLFSMANAVSPGTFDLAEMDHCHIHAVAFYLVLPGPSNPKEAFKEMLAAARKLENELAGELKDDRHSTLSKQTIEHYRQRIAEFERKRRLNR